MAFEKIWLLSWIFVSWFSSISLAVQTPSNESTTAPEITRLFLEDNCYDCHQGDSSEAGLDLESLSDQLTKGNSQTWSRIFDRVHDREMPPPEHGEVDAEELDQFLNSTGDWIRDVQTQASTKFGRVAARRLTNLQLERTLHDLLGINIPLAALMPEEPRTGGFSTVASGQPMSHFQLRQHVDIVDVALDNAFQRAFTRKSVGKAIKLSPEKISRPEKRKQCREPELIDSHAVTWNGQLPFYGKILKTEVKEDGWYRFHIKAKGVRIPEDRNGIWCSIRSGHCISSAPLLTWIDSFEASQELKEITVVAWMLKGHMLEIRPADATLKKLRFHGGQVESGFGSKSDVSGVAIKSIEMQRIEPGGDNDRVRKLLFGDHRVTFNRNGGSVRPAKPEQTLKRLVHRFANKAFRRPVSITDVEPWFEIANQKLTETGNFVDALRIGYRSVLCSPRFLYFYETPGKLDDFAIAARLSYLLWNRMLDEELWLLAGRGQLAQPNVLRNQIERMLNDPKADQFVVDLAEQWLDMDQIDFTEPDRKLYPGFDPVVQHAMLDETRMYLQTMLDNDLSISKLIDSDFTFVNSRLADYYGLQLSEETSLSDQTARVSLSSESNRGGLLTHGSILKVTANGSTTSPVLRGVWVSERLLGQPIPPPPENVPAIEPDIRGAKSIRDMLTKHKSDQNCAACHKKIDPPGFALENFDPSGRWRTHYGKHNNKKKKPKKLLINAGFEMPDGTEFRNLNQFKKIILKDQRKLAANVVEKLLTYGTGGTIRFADRDDVDRIVENTAEKDFGFRSLLKEVILSDLFLSK